MNGRVSSSWWRFVALMVVFLAAYGVCVEPAVSGHQQWNLGGAVGALCGVLYGSRSRDAAFWRLAPADRRRVVAARRTGEPTWDPELDLVIREHLRQAARHPRSRWPVATVLTAVALAVPVVAAVRTGTGWYVLAVVPMSAPALLAVRAATLEDPRRRLARLEAAMAAGPPPEDATDGAVGEAGGGVRPAGTGR